MSEQNVLNPTQGSLLGPDYGYAEAQPELRQMFQARSGNLFLRQQAGLGRSYALTWSGRDLATKHALQQWEAQYLFDFFTFADWERGRYFTGHFDGPLKYSPSGNSQWNISGTFAELPGLPMFAYPTNWARDAVFLEERDGFGEDLVKLTGAGWIHAAFSSAHGGGDYISGNANDTAEWAYFGYSFRYWSRTESDVGIIEISCTRVRDSFAMVAATNVDLYHATSLASAAVFDSTAVRGFPLDFYRVKAKVTGTKNSSSSSVTCIADAIEVMK